MGHLSIRDLQKISGKAISELPGLTAIKSGDHVVALLTPIRPPNLERLKAVLARAEALAKERDPKEDDEALKGFGEVDPVNWTAEAVHAVRNQDV
jgi:hypothetical protein